MPSPWFVRPRPARPAARSRLVCFPFAGGSAQFYRTWNDVVPPDIELVMVELPGRGMRFGEPFLARVPDVVDALAAAMPELEDRPFAFFGHSMGALLAFELASRLQHDGRPGPGHLFASGRPAPQFASRAPLLAGRDDPGLVAMLEEMGGTPAEVLAHPELRALVLPVIRADFGMCERWEPRPPARLACPVRAFGGSSDAFVSEAELAGWSAAAPEGRFSARVFPGGHFFLQPHRDAVVADVVATLRS